MEPWVIALIFWLSYYLLSMFIAILIIGKDAGWRADNYFSVIFLIPVLPLVWPLFVFNKKKKPEEEETKNV